MSARDRQCGGRSRSPSGFTLIELLAVVTILGKPFVFVDEAEDSIDDGHFLVWPSPDTRWVNLPAGRHNQSGVLSFADGHVEHWKWQAAKTFRPKQSDWKPADSEADYRDLRRLQAATLPVTRFAPQGVSN